MSEFTFPSYAYVEFPERITDRLSYGENHPERREFRDLLNRARRNGWEVKELGALVDFVEVEVEPHTDMPEETVNYLGLEDIQSGNGKAVPMVMQGREILSACKRMYRGNIVYSGLRPYLNKSHIIDVDAVLGSPELFVMKPREELVESDFLLRYLLSDLTLTQVRWILTGCSYPRLDQRDFECILVLRPTDITEQRDIVRRVARLELDAERIRTDIDGRLTHINENIANQLGLRIETNEKYDYRPLHPEEVVNRLDFGFNVRFYGELEQAKRICKYPFGLLSTPLVRYSKETTNPLERPNEEFEYADIGNVDPRWGELHTTTMFGKDATSSRVRRVIRAGQVLISTTRPTRRAIAIVPDKLDGQVCSTGFAVVECSDEIDRRYLFRVLRTAFMRNQFERFSSGSGYPAINKETDLPLVEIPIPPLDVQRDLLSAIEGAVRESRQLEDEATVKWQESRRLFKQAILIDTTT